MAHLLRILIIIKFVLIGATILVAHHFLNSQFSHIKLSIPSFLFAILIQALVMFYFIGVARLVDETNQLFSNNEKSAKELFEAPPENLDEYKNKISQIAYSTQLYKRKSIPWTMLIIVLGMLAFLMGGAHDTGLVAKETHSGLVYGFFTALVIGSINQWFLLGKANSSLRIFKALFSIPNSRM